MTESNAKPEARSQPARPRTKRECLAAVVAELNLNTTDPFTRMIAAALALQDAYDESRAALARCQEEVHRLSAPRWIPVSERLPTHIHSVLMWVVDDHKVPGEPYQEIGIYNDRRGKWQMGWDEDEEQPSREAAALKRPESKDPHDERAELQRQFLHGVEIQRTLVERMERLAKTG